MALDIFFNEDIRNRLTALAMANARALKLAKRYGMDAEAAELCWQVYAGALSDVAAAFGLALTIPNREEVITCDREQIDGRARYEGIPAAIIGHR